MYGNIKENGGKGGIYMIIGRLVNLGCRVINYFNKNYLLRQFNNISVICSVYKKGNKKNYLYYVYVKMIL